MMKCDICEESLVDRICAISCGHLFHRECIEKVEEIDDTKFCPICYLKFETESIRDIYPTIEEDMEAVIIKKVVIELGCNIEQVEQRIAELKERNGMQNSRKKGSQKIETFLAYPVKYDSDSVENFKPKLSDDFLKDYDDRETSYFNSPNYQPDSPAYSHCEKENCNQKPCVYCPAPVINQNNNNSSPKSRNMQAYLVKKDLNEYFNAATEKPN